MLRPPEQEGRGGESRLFRFPAAYGSPVPSPRRTPLVRPFAADAVEDHPWGEQVASGRQGVRLLRPARGRMTLKLESMATLSLDGAERTGYGLGAHGGDPLTAPGVTPALLRDWIEESYRIVVPKRLVDAGLSGSLTRARPTSWHTAEAWRQPRRVTVGRDRVVRSRTATREVDRQTRSRTSSCAAISTERAPFSEQTASTLPAARWQRESAASPSRAAGRRAVRPPRRWRRSSRWWCPRGEDLDRVGFGAGPRAGDRRGTHRAPARPSILPTEVGDVREDDVPHRRPVRDRERE